MQQNLLGAHCIYFVATTDHMDLSASPRSRLIPPSRGTELLEFVGTAVLPLGFFFLHEFCVMNRFFRAPVRTFVAGLLAVLPVVLTVAVIVWVAGLVAEFVGPDSAVGKLLVSIGLTVVETRIAA
jgi:hypothetical protein